MDLVGQLLGNGLVVFGTTSAIVLLLARVRERQDATSLAPPSQEAGPPALRLVTAMPGAPRRIEPAMAESLLAAAGTSMLASASAPDLLGPCAASDRAALLHRISVSHVQTAHPVFRPQEVSATRSDTPSPARRPASAVRPRRRVGSTRPQHARLHLVRRADPVGAEPLPEAARLNLAPPA